ncbi:MAG: MMPL family transporter [Spirochaetales bacterium]|nr:MMPL family transporter [Spirochaetales bacterium]
MQKKENFRERILGTWASWSSRNWGKAFLIIAGITAVMAVGMSMLKMEMTFYSILPDNTTQVRDMKMIMEEFPAASSIMAVVDARSIGDPLEAEKKVKEGIDAIVERISEPEFSRYVVRVTGKTDMDFYKEHGLMFSKEKDIERSAGMYGNLDLVPLIRAVNDDFEREYSGDGEKLADEEQLAVGMFRGLDEVLGLIESSAKGQAPSDRNVDSALDDWLFGESYILSNDSRMGIAIIQPTFTMEDIMDMTNGVNAIERAVKDLGREMGLPMGLTGMVVVGRDEMATSEQGIVLSSLLALIAILLIMIFTFRMFSVPFISGIPLVTGIFWTMGMSGFVIHRLNIMTAMYLVALLGLGIDFAIHLLTAYRQELDEGDSFSDAMRQSLVKSGPGILTGGLTTATAFFALVLADTQMIRELGIVAGMGIVCELIAMILFIPPLLGFRDYRRTKKGKVEHSVFDKVKIRSDAASGIGKVLVKAPVLFSLIMLAIGIFFGLKAPGVQLETNLMKMEAEGLESIELQDTLVDEFGMAPDSLSIISDDPAEVRDFSDRLDDLSSVKMVDSLGAYYLSPDDAERRGKLIRDFASALENRKAGTDVDSDALLEELYRLEMNVMEMGDMAYLGNLDKLLNTINRITGLNEDGEKIGESRFDRLFAMLEEGDIDREALAGLQNRLQDQLGSKLMKMANDEPVSFDVLPDSLKDSYISRDGKQFLMNIMPTQNPWEQEFRGIYTQQISTVTDKATGMLLAGDQLTYMAEKDGVKAAIVAIIVVFLILLADFRNIKLVVLTMASLLLSFLTLFGFMALAGIRFDFINIIVVPLLIGIGVDDAVHINHRYLREGKGKMKSVIGKTGTALLITSLTTIVGFVSFVPSPMRAMRSTGIVLSIAMAIAFCFSVLFHPGMLIIMREKLNLKIKPWNRSEK